MAERRRTGSDRYDEVWDGVYVMAPLADDEHQALVSGLTTVLQLAVEWAGLGNVRPGVNISDMEDGWEKNYRCPDVVAFLKSTQAKNCKTHWCGGPDFVVEVTSPYDRTREKLDFYAHVRTRELLLVDRNPWVLELYRLDGSRLVRIGLSSLHDATILESQLLPLRWQLVEGDDRPAIQVTHTDGTRQWSI